MKSSVPVMAGLAAARCLPAVFMLVAGPRSAFAAQPDMRAAAIVKVVQAGKECFSDSISVTGIFVPRQEAIIVLDGTMNISEVLVAEGDQVKLGQPLARATKLGAPPGSPSAKPPSGPSTVTIRAPASGTMIQTAASAREGAAAAGQPLFRIMVDNEIEFQAEIPSVQVSKLRPQQTARIALEDGTELIGQVRAVPVQIDRATQLGYARLSVARHPSVRVGMFAEAAIDAAQSCGVSVPRSAVLHQTGGTSVQIVRNQTVETRPVRVGLSSSTRFEIKEGLEEGENVIASAGTSLHDGDRVQTELSEETAN